MTAGYEVEDGDPVRLTPGARRLLDVASELFYQHGIHAVGVDLIARESGVTKRTLYDRFGSKDALVLAYLRERHRSWWEELEERLRHAARPRALAFFDAYLEPAVPVDRGCAYLNASGELDRDHPGYAFVQQHKLAVRERLAEVVREDAAVGASQGAGDRRDVRAPGLDDELCDHLFLLLEGAVAHRGIGGGDGSLRRARAFAARLLSAAEPPPRAPSGDAPTVAPSASAHGKL
ncbi:TetR/AcrR family transcriptional regulator [Leucobacter massiliensis]|uniref:HTH tetR-type domain-containing protein n=1 Tax=Leucobacter massiliensis TaxID=1686285 RepID=A0A2S9QRI1_9MICO|nr:TetR/AcrR family transcriptional regulator [Leucobacter massiliensis]PRI12196.1 hypothetical protein B4915_03855 [Leucobacter massiliensis]